MTNLTSFIATLRNPRWHDAGHTSVAFDATWNGQQVLFVALSSDQKDYVQQAIADANSGKYGTVGAYVAPVATTPTVQQLAAKLSYTASAVCSTVLTQIQPDDVHQTAFANAASIINANGGSAPTVGPMASRLASLALAYGLKNNDNSGNVVALASLVNALQGSSLDLSNALITLQRSAGLASTTNDLSAALSTFEASLSSIITEINAVVPIPITTPPSISIVGINA